VFLGLQTFHLELPDKGNQQSLQLGRGTCA